MNNLHIWLAYAASPVTAAAYFERALRKLCHTTTIGPPLPQELIEKWQIRRMKLPFNEQDISTTANPDMRQILAAVPPADYPDLYLWVESIDGYYPSNLDALPCPTACYLINTHLNLSHHLEWAKQFDIVFIAQREYLDEFRKQGTRVHWLPLGCDPEVHRRVETPKLYPVGFAGGVQPGSRREKLLNTLISRIPVHYERCFLDDMAQLYAQSQIGFNEATHNDLNMRVFEIMSTGTLLLTDIAKNSGQEELFKDGEDYVVYQDSIIYEVARFYLDNEELREQIAARGRQLVHNAHTYDRRIEDLLAVALGGKADTFSAGELRKLSLISVPAIDAGVPASSCISSVFRSFIIPVLDMSPASEYNILTLLNDLKDIEGDVIVVFNGQEIAEQLKDHPRITRYAIMKQNIGVSRAWNLGLEIAVTPTAFILNADLHVERFAIDTLEQALLSLPDAACVGPQGSFFCFSLAKDYKYFDKGTFDQPVEVDAVSGFFFALKVEHFNQKIIRFENGFTPCYFEEWDLGLQIKRAGLKNYIIPTTGYDHHWSGSIRALREIRFYEKAETAGEILLRNRKIILNKWRGIAGRDNNPDLLESGFAAYVAHHAQALVDKGRFDDARNWLDESSLLFPDSSKFAVLRRYIDILDGKAAEQVRQQHAECV
jgi:hypothetical protein